MILSKIKTETSIHPGEELLAMFPTKSPLQHFFQISRHLTFMRALANEQSEKH